MLHMLYVVMLLLLSVCVILTAHLLVFIFVDILTSRLYLDRFTLATFEL